MSRFKQNFLYILISAIIFAGFYYYFANNKYETKGIFLSNISVKMPAVDVDNVRVYNLRYRSDAKGSVGIIRTSTHVSSSTEFKELCDKDLKKALELASENGINEIKYLCMYPEGKIDALSNVSLLAYVFRD